MWLALTGSRTDVLSASVATVVRSPADIIVARGCVVDVEVSDVCNWDFAADR